MTPAAPTAPPEYDTLADAVRALGDVPLHRILWRPYPGTATEEDHLRLVTDGRKLRVELVDGVLVHKAIGRADFKEWVPDVETLADVVDRLGGVPLDRVLWTPRPGTATEDDVDAGKAELGRIQGDIRFDDVWFEYHENQPVLKGVSFHAAPGTTTALVGSSGSGKSTLISLVMAFNRPLKGRIFVDGRDLATIPLHDYREQLASVLQENFLFDGTIAENIGYANPSATLDEIKHAARVAHCEEFILKFPEGYETVVGERGIKLSGGQRQRVSIARAILANPRVLILDEATSSLDSESEEMIQDGLRSLREGRTSFVIAHRLSTIRSADQILVLEGGEIVERGTHGELLALNGRYRQLHDKQYKLETDRFINPGEDFTPEPAKAAPVKAVSSQL